MRLLIASPLCAAACASSATHIGEEERAVSILTVRNQRSENLTIYVMHDGYKGRRLGIAPARGHSVAVQRFST